ncbi:uncharacterized protein EDB93DRAFT_1242105 [Suillus bovinus]|uniref:uncharacterized protein n=1 Tax=Suillus bovinus TaxID=48563 RepID=UPI001B885AA8|nr:uncharacterized protein EDB93DRAFT_1242105 [Suillus bovinus]KAG2138407.1 hypothetical protein EDB93DRAFT_1242105 [Suillus bovinus]
MLGYEVGHTPGKGCYNPRPSSGDEFVVIDVHGVHEIALDFCGCASAQIHYKQLLRTYWYPATTSDPHTAATFTLMEHFQLLSFKSKVSAYKFYHSLARRNNNAGLSVIKDCYSAFMCMVHEWRHLKQLWRAGRGYDTGSIKATTMGELAVQCPACPHPGKTLSVRWKYVSFIAIDANFRLKHKAVSSDNVDPSLNSGWAYFVQETDYKTYLTHQAGVKQDRSTCVSHNAVNLADTKSSHGLAAIGVGTVDCARHDMKLANGVGDLQKGEKCVVLSLYIIYINMDYLIFSALLAFTVTMINISYNIACQWHKKLWMPPERGWSNINHITTSTKEMGPGSCRDTLNDHFGDWNWKKVMALGCMLLHKIRDTVKWKKEHGEGLAELERTVQPALILQWRKEVEAWEVDNSQPNPFESRYASKQKATMQTCITTLQRRLDAWACVQELYMPVVSQLCHRSSDAGVSNTAQLKPEAFKLWLPSELQPTAGCHNRLAEHKWDLYHTQTLDALNEVRSHLHLWSHMYIYKDRNVCGQAASTCAQALIEGVERRKCASVDKYWRTHNALLALGHRLNKSGWDVSLPPLLDSQVKPMGDMERQGTGTISWIWLDSHVDNSSSENERVQDSVQVEWCKVHVHANCWLEEVELLLEEMRRVIVFLRWQAEWWSGRRSSRTLESTADQEGLAAYTCRQAALWLSLVASFQDLWKDVPMFPSKHSSITRNEIKITRYRLHRDL